ncbi:MAG: hypothetical protein ACPIOQ_57325, partial [Promethearchaeia archaeon]
MPGAAKSADVCVCVDVPNPALPTLPLFRVGEAGRASSAEGSELKLVGLGSSAEPAAVDRGAERERARARVRRVRASVNSVRELP